MDALNHQLNAEALDALSHSILKAVNHLSMLDNALNLVNRSIRAFSNARVDSMITKMGASAAKATGQISTLNSHLAQMSKHSGGGFTISFKHGGGGGHGGGSGSSTSKLTKAVSDMGMDLLKSGAKGIPMAGEMLGTLLPVLAETGPVGLAIGASLAAVGGSIMGGQNIASTAGLTLANGQSGANNISKLADGLGFDAMSGSKQFQQSIDNGAGAFFARQAGIDPFHNDFSGAGGDYASKMAKFLKTYGDPSKTSDAKAAAAARATGLEQQIGLSRNLSEPVRKMLFEKASGYTKQEQQDSGDATAMVGVATGEFTKLLNKLAVTILPWVNEGLAALNKWLENAQMGFKAMQPLIHFFQKLPSGLSQLTKGWSALMDWINDLLKRFHLGVDEKTKDEEKNASKMKDAADNMKKAAEIFADGVYGSGASRAKGTIPMGIRGTVQNGDIASAKYWTSQGIPVF